MKEYFRKRLSEFDYQEFHRTAYQLIPLWIASVLVGVTAVLYAKSFIYVEAISTEILNDYPEAIFIITPVAFLTSWFLVQFFAPMSAGSGIPQVMAAVEMEGKSTLSRQLLNVKVSVVKVISSLIMLGGGGAIGREGPTIQISASIFSFMHHALPEKWEKFSAQLMILTGAASGLAAAFNTPLGGIVFAIEELTRVQFSKFRTTLFVAVIISGMTAQAMLGPYLYLGFPKVSIYEYSFILWVILTAAIAGFLGGMFGSLILAIHQWKQTFKTLRKHVVVVLIFSLSFASIYYFFNHAVAGAGKEILENLLFINNKDISFSLMVSRFFGPILSFGSGGAGGIFAPSLSAGGTVGAFIAYVADIATEHTNLLILAGMVGFLTGVTHSPFTSAILVLEMTDRHSVIFYLMLAGIFAYLFTMLVNKKSVYEHLKEGYLKSFLAKEEART
ncbi:chloride channel protein [Cytophaga aurantiaca]|uniref:chloride channel protein n=1 Tax=Cytophaga aurantiaca TaxID=29530 RepID=UPI00036D61AB|nr:chloride channel protein [Cytophaga aurantiaca]